MGVQGLLPKAGLPDLYREIWGTSEVLYLCSLCQWKFLADRNMSCWLLELLFPHLCDLPVVSVVYDGSMKTFGKDFEVIPDCLF